MSVWFVDDVDVFRMAAGQREALGSTFLVSLRLVL